ncbi:MAG: PAS domain S-box protein [Desulfuromonadales bacterium]|nr:PAS domain S-box protein [Desulfuromonadales bacterium]
MEMLPNKLLENVLDSLPIPVFYKDEKGLYLSCNSAFETFFGLSRELLAGKSVHDVFDRENARKFSEMDLKLYRNPGKQVYESRVLDSKGQLHDVMFHKATFLHPQGGVAGIVGAVLDTTELKATERKLTGATTSFNRIFDSIPDLLSVVDSSLRIIYSNWQGGHDYVAEDIRSHHPYCYDAYYPGQGKPCDPCHLLEVFRTGKPLITEKHNPRIGYQEIHAFPVCDESGTVIMAAEYIRNITARREAEHALRQANHLLEALINASPLAIVAFDTDVRLTLWNTAAESMFDWKKEEVLSKPYPIIPEDRIEEVRNNIRLMHEGEVCRSLETRRKRKDGSLVDVSLSTAVMSGPDGAVIGYMSIMSDITERKRAVQALRESEERFRRIFEEDEDAALILTPRTFSIVDANAAAARLYGYSKKELRKHTPALFLEREEFKRFGETFAMTDDEASSRSKWCRIDRLDVVEKSGNRVATSVRGRMFISQGTPYLYCTFRDITEKLNIREERKRFEEKLIQANKMSALGTLASGIAHEINNPNNYIMSSTQFLHEAWKDIEWVLLEYGKENGDYSLGGLPDAEAIAVIPQLLTSLEEGSVRIKNIVENLKSFARQEKQPYSGTVDVNMAIKAALNLLGNQIHTYTDSFVCELDEGVPHVPGSLQQIEQVIINLTMNALQALPYKRCGVQISTFHDTTANQVVIKVRDQGKGIPPDMLRRIMEPFYTTKQDMGGTGLGLSICYSIVKKHQGTIDCESIPDRGTVFSVRLPVAGALS